MSPVRQPVKMEPRLPETMAEDTRSETSTVPATADDLAGMLKCDLASHDAVETLSNWVDERAAKIDMQPEEPSETVKPGNEHIVEQLRAAIQKGDLGPRSGQGQRFSQWLTQNPDKQEEYNSMNGKPGVNQFKKDWRLKWAATDLAGRVIVKKTRRQILQAKVGEKGKYMAYDRIIVKEGGLGNPAATRRATNYVLAALERGPPFIEYNSWKKETEILCFEKIKDSVFKESWELSREQSAIIDSEQASSAAEPPAITPAKRSKPSQPPVPTNTEPPPATPAEPQPKKTTPREPGKPTSVKGTPGQDKSGKRRRGNPRPESPGKLDDGKRKKQRGNLQNSRRRRSSRCDTIASSRFRTRSSGTSRTTRPTTSGSTTRSRRRGF